MYTTKPKNTKLKITSAIVVTLAVVMLVIASTAMRSQEESQNAQVKTPNAETISTPSVSDTTTPPSAPSSEGAAQPIKAAYKDGTYTASGSYFVPSGNEEIEVSLTIKDDRVTDSSVGASEAAQQAIVYQRAFISEYKSFVTGKSIAELKLSNVAGASYTTDAFNDAVAKIKTEAKS